MTAPMNLSDGHVENIVAASAVNSAFRQKLDDARLRGLPHPCGALITLKPVTAGLIWRADRSHDVRNPNGGSFFGRLRRRLIAAMNRVSS